MYKYAHDPNKLQVQARYCDYVTVKRIHLAMRTLYLYIYIYIYI